MGCGASKEGTAAKARNDEIEYQLRRDKMVYRHEIKLLLLGPCLRGRVERKTNNSRNW